MSYSTKEKEKAYYKKWYAKNREKKLAQCRQWYHENYPKNKEKINLKNRNYYLKNIEKERLRSKKKYLENRKEWGLMNRAEFRESIKGEGNRNWKGDSVGYTALHLWIKNRVKKPSKCECCKVNKPYDLTNISQKYKRDLSDWEWLCRKCHMRKDGRMKNLKQYQEKEKQKIIEEFLSHKRCFTCGEPKEQTPLSDTCAECFENA